MTLSPDTLPTLQALLAELELDGWLLFDFQGTNPIAMGVLGLEGLLTRRIFVFVPREGVPTAITNSIEQGPWRNWPGEWRREQYAAWDVLEVLLQRVIGGKRVAMEYLPRDAVPYLDRVPAGVVELVRASGAQVVTSADLVTRFYAVWSPEHLASHQRAATVIAEIGQDAIRLAGARTAAGAPISEFELQEWIVSHLHGAGLQWEHMPIVAASENAADPHYEPLPDFPRPIQPGDTLLVDLWGYEPGGVYADQTWMGVLGTPSPRVIAVWNAVCEARDAALALLRAQVEAGVPIRGAQVHNEARRVLTAHGFGGDTFGRTGHSIDPRSIHGAGPNIDNFETREERLLVPGVGFSVEPGIYIPGEIGMRSEVNVFVGAGEILITPSDYQRDLLVV